MDKTEIRRAFGRFSTGVTVVTTVDAEQKLTGMTVNSFCSLSLEPPLVIVCVDFRSKTYAHFLREKQFVIHILSGSQCDLAKGFAKSGTDKSTLSPWHIDKDGFATLDAFDTAFKCTLHDYHGAGDHVIMIGHVESVVERGGDEALLFHRGQMLALQDHRQASTGSDLANIRAAVA